MENLNSTKSFISRVRKVKGDKIEIEVAQLKKSNKGNLVALLNKGDDRFSSNAPRRAWMTVTLDGILEQLPQLAEVAKRVHAGAIGAFEGRVKGDKSTNDSNLGSAVLADGTNLIVQVKEDIAPLTKYQADTGTGIKRKGANGPVMTHGGKSIYSATFVVPEGIEDVLLEADEVATTVATELPTALQNAQVG